MAPSSDFDSLRREATKLERHLEEKVSRYQQMVQKVNTQDQSLDALLQNAESGVNHNSDQEELALRNDIQRTLNHLSDLISQKLAPASEVSGKSQHALLVKRFREILFDLSSDFTKSSGQYTRRKQQMELFAGASPGMASGVGGPDEATQHLMRERGHINNSLSASADIINQAAEIHSNLKTQGMSLRGVQGTILRMTSNIPGLNRVVDAIRRRRNRDDMIVSGVVAFCILFTLWYIFG